MADAADVSHAALRTRWSRRGFLTTWGVAGVGATLLSACGPQVSPPAATTAPAAPAPTSAAAAPAATTAAKPAAAATTAPAAAAAATAAPKPAAAGAVPKDGGSFRFSILTEDPPTLDPYLNVSFRTQEFAAFFYSRLLMSK